MSKEPYSFSRIEDDPSIEQCDAFVQDMIRKDKAAKKLSLAAAVRKAKAKPIRVFFSPLSRRFYASRDYKELSSGCVDITGEKFDVTNDIARLMIEHDVTFRDVTPKPKAGKAR